MSVILTAPPRIAMMVEDIPLMKKGFWQEQKAISTEQRPCCLVRIDEGQYPKSGSSDVPGEEVFVIDYIGLPFDQGESHKYEMQARQHAYDIFLYFMQCPGLQMLNRRNRQSGQLGYLDQVQWSRISRRSPVNLMVGNGIEIPFWGFSYGLTVFSVETIREVLVPKVSS